MVQFYLLQIKFVFYNTVFPNTFQIQHLIKLKAKAKYITVTLSKKNRGLLVVCLLFIFINPQIYHIIS